MGVRRPFPVSLMIITSGRSYHVGCHGRRLPSGNLGSYKGALVLSSRGSNALKTDRQRHVLASSGYLELGMLDDAAMVLEEITPADKTRSEVLGARVGIYLAKKWAMAAPLHRSQDSELLLRGNLLLAFIPFTAVPFLAGLVSPSSTALARGACRSRFLRLGIRRSRVLRPSLRAFNSGTLRMLVRFGE